ncbi:tyrosine-trna ligase [Phaffia rhodozyma]|uniref:Tyrosine--tRNA ligase n=1 Tax=Phaffia rhodozyma TaxID=264483 RepID=A0A0F7SHA8_PHARH|nr:tyrosine-trna ligase [Phaffia rhodozyma]
MSLFKLGRAFGVRSGLASSSLSSYYSFGSRRSVGTNIVDDLTERGFVANITSPKLKEATMKPISVYLGVDPTAKSLHAGNLLALLGLLHFHIKGHQVFALVGGFTGSIGDPSGRSSERQALSPATLALNVEAITFQINTFLERGQRYATKYSSDYGTGKAGELKSPKVVNNMDWSQEITLLDFLRTVGKEVKVQHMLNRDSVKNRLSSEAGISFTEFTYQLLQAQDFLHLHKTHQVTLQLGGSDQWGNITAGIDLIHRSYSAESREGHSKSTHTPAEIEEKEGLAVRKDKAWGLTIPLLTTSSGEKFGKSVGNPVWLDDGLTSVFDFYQFFLRVQDADVERYLKLFTLLPLKQIENIMTDHNNKPETRSAQRILASEVTELVHGQRGLSKAQTQTKIIYGSDLPTLTTSDVLEAFTDDPRLKFISREDLDTKISVLIAKEGMVPSRRAANTMITSGGFTLNGQKVTDPQSTLSSVCLIDKQLVVLKLGKAGNFVVCVKDE